MALLTIEDIVAQFAEIDRDSLKEAVTDAKNHDYTAVREGLARYIRNKLPDPNRGIGTPMDADTDFQEFRSARKDHNYEGAMRVLGRQPKIGMDGDAIEFCTGVIILSQYLISPEDTARNLAYIWTTFYVSDRALGAIGVGAHSLSEKGKRSLNEDPTGLSLLSEVIGTSGDDLPITRGFKFFSDTYTRLLNEVTARN